MQDPFAPLTSSAGAWEVQGCLGCPYGLCKEQNDLEDGGECRQGTGG
jgi:hypothetical protein